MLRMATVAFVYVFIAIAGEAGAAENGEFHCPKPNTVLEYTSGAKTRLVEQNGFECSYVSLISGGKWTDHALLFNVKPESEGLNGDVLAKAEALWPLQAGKTVEIILNRNSQRYRQIYAVKPLETLSVAAGTFAAWPIEIQQSRIPSIDLLVHTYWWSPELGATIKHEAHSVRGRWDNVGSYYELLSVRTP